MAVVSPETPSHRLTGLLAYYSRRARRDLRARYLGMSAAIIGAVWCLAALALYLDLPLPAGTWVVCIALTVAVPVLAFGIATLRSPSIRRAAALLDERLDNKQRLVTSMELIDAGPLPPVSWAQVETSAGLLGSANPDMIYPMRSPVAHYSLGAGLLSVALGLFFLKAVGGSFTPITAGGQPLGSPTPLAMTSPTPQSGLPNSQAQQDQPTPAAGANVQPGVDPQDAARKAEESQKAQNGLDRLKSALDEQSATQGAADSLRQGNYDDAAKKLGDLGTQNDQLSDAAKQGISDALNRAANDSGSTPDLQNAERKAADALQSGDYNASSQALKDLGDAIKSTAQQVVPQQELTKGFPQQGQDSAQSGQSQGQQGQQDQQSGQGQSGDQSQQNGQGQGQGQNDSANSGNGNGQQGQGQGQNGQGQSQQGGQGQGQNGSGADNSQAQSQGQDGGSGKGQSRVSGPNDYTPRNIQGDPFQLQGKGDPNQPDAGDPNNPNKPGISLQGNTGNSSQALPPEQGGPVTAPSESNQVPVERWGIIQKYFSHEK